MKSFHSAVVTGASSGIGKALCSLLAKQGINLIISGRNRDQLEAVASSLSSSVMIVPVDLADANARKYLLEVISKHVPDLIINNAGEGLYGDVCMHSMQKQKDILEVNACALLEITLKACEVLIANKRQGTILNVSSIAGKYIFPSFSVYAASKAFVTQFSLALNIEMQEKGIRVLVSCPGQVITQFAKRAAGQILKNSKSTFAMTAAFAAEQIWWQIQKEKPLHVFDWRYRYLSWFALHLFSEQFLAKRLRKQILQRIS